MGGNEGYFHLPSSIKQGLITFSSARTGEPSHPISDWQGHIAESYQKNCRDYLRSLCGRLLRRNAMPRRSKKCQVSAHPSTANNRTGCRIPRSCSRMGGGTNREGAQPYVPIRFVPFEKISKHYKLMQG
jgi:hypothetical protein